VIPMTQDKQTQARPIAETLLERPQGNSATIRQFRLERVEGDIAKEQYECASDRCSVGSHERNDVVLAEPTVSRFHCEIRVDSDRARVVDLESRNGTVLDGVAVRDAFLRAGSILKLGRVALRFQPSTERSALQLSTRTELCGLVGSSAAMRACFAVLERAAESDVTLLLEGETGTGKSRAARAVHELSRRNTGPFLILDCGAIPATLLESELFGHVRGAFTGASEDRPGILEEAAGGSVFLDEIGELPLEVQAKLLRALEDREIRRIGTNTYRSIDVRIIAATNRDLRAEVNAVRFRADLFYRLAVVRVTLPPLRQRPEDIPAIAAQLLDVLGASGEASASLRTPEFLARLETGAWPGNIRELRNHLERCLVFRDAMPPTEGSEPPARVVADARLPYAEARRRVLDAFERDYAERLIETHGGNVARAAQAAEVDRAHLYKLLRRHRKA
jgi:two-component system, NtrC family, response regulator GlrR